MFYINFKSLMFSKENLTFYNLTGENFFFLCKIVGKETEEEGLSLPTNKAYSSVFPPFSAIH